MHCKHCGKAIGTDRGICPFCGAMLTKEQMKIYSEQQRENSFRPKLITEKYGEKPVIYEKREENFNFFIVFIIIVLGIIIALGILILVLI